MNDPTPITQQEVEAAAAKRDQAWQAYLNAESDEAAREAGDQWEFARKHWHILSLLRELQTTPRKEVSE